MDIWKRLRSCRRRQPVAKNSTISTFLIWKLDFDIYHKIIHHPWPSNFICGSTSTKSIISGKSNGLFSIRFIIHSQLSFNYCFQSRHVGPIDLIAIGVFFYFSTSIWIFSCVWLTILNYFLYTPVWATILACLLVCRFCNWGSLFCSNFEYVTFLFLLNKIKYWFVCWVSCIHMMKESSNHKMESTE